MYKTVSLLCILIQFILAALSVASHKALILLVFFNQPYQSLVKIRVFGQIVPRRYEKDAYINFDGACNRNKH